MTIRIANFHKKQQFCKHLNQSFGQKQILVSSFLTVMGLIKLCLTLLQEDSITKEDRTFYMYLASVIWLGSGYLGTRCENQNFQEHVIQVKTKIQKYFRKNFAKKSLAERETCCFPILNKVYFSQRSFTSTHLLKMFMVSHLIWRSVIFFMLQ